MKKILLMLLSFVCASAMASSVPSEFSVVTRFPTGSPNTLARAVFAAYAKEYKANVNIVIKPGADGILASEDVVSSDKFTVLFATTSELIFNFREYPQHVKMLSDLQVTNIIASTVVSFSTGPNSKYQTLPELIANKKQITVGTHSTSHALIAKKIFREDQLVLVPFKFAQQALPSLLDGSLDVYVAGGTFEELHSTNRLKSLGHLHGLPNSIGVPLDKTYTEAVKYPSFMALAVSKTMPPEAVQEFSLRIANIMKKPEIQQVLVGAQSIYVPHTLQQATTLVERTRAEVLKTK